jgi:hypothetical protein
VTLDSAATGTVTLKDSSGKVILTTESPKEFSVVQLSASALKSGESYTLTAGDQSVTIDMDSLHYGQLTGMGGRGGHGGMAPSGESGTDQSGKGGMGHMHGGMGKGKRGMGPGGRDGEQAQSPDDAQVPQGEENQASLSEDSFEADSTVSA